MNFENEKDILKRKEKFQTLLDNSFGSGETITYKNKYIKLGKTLDFKSELSYCDYSNTSYNMFLLGEDSEAYLFDVLTNQKYSRL